MTGQWELGSHLADLRPPRVERWTNLQTEFGGSSITANFVVTFGSNGLVPGAVTCAPAPACLAGVPASVVALGGATRSVQVNAGGIAKIFCRGRGLQGDRAMRKLWSKGRVSPSHRSAKGFTMVEVLVTTTVLLVAFLGLMSTFGGGFSNVAEAGKGTAAVAAAESMLELIKMQPAGTGPQFNGVTTANPASCPPPPQQAPCQAWIAQVTTPPNGLPNGSGRVVVQTTPGPRAFYTVTVNVSWVEAGRGRKTVTLVTGITQ